MRRLRVLALAPYPDTAPSTRFRVAQLQRPLARQGIEVVLHPFVDAQEYGRLREDGVWAAGTFARASSRLWDTLGELERFDAVWIQRGLTLLMDGVFLRRLEGSGVPFLYDFDDAVYLRQEGGRRWMEMLRRPDRITRSLCRGAGAVAAGNQHLADYARSAVAGTPGPAVVRVVPTVVDTERFSPPPELATGPSVVGWVGSDSTLPYLEPLAPALARLQDRMDVEVRVVAGSTRPRLPGVDFEYEPWRPEIEASCFHGMDVGLYPLEDTPWSRGKCGFKAIQYMASGVPCVASPVGVLRSLVTPGETGFHAEGEEEWVEACQRLLDDPLLRREMGSRGRKRVEEAYSTQVAGDALAELFHGLAGRS